MRLTWWPSCSARGSLWAPEPRNTAAAMTAVSELLGRLGHPVCARAFEDVIDRRCKQISY
jgi:hypothetical protein